MASEWAPLFKCMIAGYWDQFKSPSLPTLNDSDSSAPWSALCSPSGRCPWCWSSASPRRWFEPARCCCCCLCYSALLLTCTIPPMLTRTPPPPPPPEWGVSTGAWLTRGGILPAACPWTSYMLISLRDSSQRSLNGLLRSHGWRWRRRGWDPVPQNGEWAHFRPLVLFSFEGGGEIDASSAGWIVPFTFLHMLVKQRANLHLPSCRFCFYAAIVFPAASL